MKKTLLMFALCLGIVYTFQAQSKVLVGKSCSVILLNNQWLIKSYESSEKITITKNAKGILSVHETGDIAKKSYKKELIAFKIGILKKSDRTITSFSDDTYQEIELNDVLKKCESGDKIIILLKDDQKYSLPHHQIEVVNARCSFSIIPANFWTRTVKNPC